MNKEEMRLYQQERRRKLKAGTLQPQEHTTNEWLSSFCIGETRWFETSLEKYASDERALNIPRSRRSVISRDWKITTALFTAVSCSKAGDVRYLLLVTRVK